MSITITPVDVRAGVSRLHVAVEAAITLAAGEAPAMSQLRRETEALEGLGHIDAWLAMEEVLSGMHTRRVQDVLGLRARGGRRSEMSRLIDEEVELCLSFVRQVMKQRAEAAARAGLIDEAGD